MRAGAWGIGLALWGALAQAADVEPPLLQHDRQTMGVAERTEAAYAEVLARYDAALAAQPTAALAVARCRFIADFVDTEAVIALRAEEDLAACEESLERQHGDSPEAKLWRLDNLWGESRQQAGDALLAESEAWPEDLRRRLLSTLSIAYESSENALRAGELAVTAVALGETDRVGAAVGHLVATGDEAGAVKLLRESELPRNAWDAAGRLRAANRLQDASIALQEIERYRATEVELPAADVARAHLRAGDAERAAEALGEAHDPGLRFDIALARGDFATALAQIDFTDTERFALHLGRFATLATRAPALLMTPKMLAGVALMLFIVLMLALLPGVLLVPVHYRGLVRRVAGRLPTPLFERIGLRHAWAGVAVFLAAQFLLPALLTPGALGALLDGEAAGDAFLGLFAAAAASTAIAFVLLRPLGRRALWGDVAIWKRGYWVPLAWLAIMAVAVLLQWLHGPADDGSQKLIRDVIEGGGLKYGALTTFAFIALLTPLLEEWIFRGLLLGGLSRHVSFGWANTLQAATFALAHGDPARFLFFFALGLACGALVGRTRSLALAVALHAFNNAAAWWLMTVAT